MKRSTNLQREQSQSMDLWLVLRDAEQIVVNHEYYHPRMHKQLNDLMNIVEIYQSAIEHQLEQQSECEP
jgi:hypothetical protein